MATKQDFAQAILTAGGWPLTQSNEQFMLAWMQREGGTAANNPINTTQDAAGATDYNKVGVKNYPSMDEGVQAIVSTLAGGYYKNIRAALASGNATEADRAGSLASDLHAWSAGPSAPMSKGYTSVTGGGAFKNLETLAQGVVSSVGSAVSGAAQEASNTQAATGDIDGFLQSQAPELAKALSDPEAKKLLTAWGTGQLSDEEFQDQLEATTWWKKTPQSQRVLLVSQATDPATAVQNLTNQQRSIQTLAQQMGVPVDDAQAYSIALTSIKDQWSQQQIQQNIADRYSLTASTAQGGEAGTDLQQLKDLYAAYALPPGNDASLQGQLQQVLAGKTTIAQFGAQLAQQAKSLYGNNPDLAGALDRGETVRQYMQPYANVASQRLGIDPSQVDWTDPKWNAALTGTTDPASGRTTPMSLMQWQRNIMTNPVYGWATSQDGINQATQGAQVIAQGLGLGVG